MQNLIKYGLLLLLLLPTTAKAGGGWPQPQNHGFLKLYEYFIIADNYYTPEGEIIDITTTGYYATSIYFEYGITDRLTGIINFPFFVRSTLNRVETSDGDTFSEGDYLNSIGDTDLTLKYNLTNGKWVTAASLTFGIPLGESTGGETGLLQSGDGEFNQMISGHLSRSFGKGNTYSSLYLGFNNRTQNFSDEIRWGLEGGTKVGDFWLIGRLNAIHSLMNGDESAISTNGIFNNNIEFVAFSPEVNYNINEKWGISMSAGFALYGKRILADPAYSGGLFYNF